MLLHKPFEISSRLLPSIVIGGVTISMEYAGRSKDNRTIYRYYIDKGKKSFSRADLHSGVGGGDLQSGFGSLFAFLGDSETLSDDFPEWIQLWSENFRDDIYDMRLDLEDNDQTLIEE